MLHQEMVAYSRNTAIVDECFRARDSEVILLTYSPPQVYTLQIYMTCLAQARTCIRFYPPLSQLAAHHSRQASTSSNPYPYPVKPHPTPHEIFHLPRSASRNDVKTRCTSPPLPSRARSRTHSHAQRNSLSLLTWPSPLKQTTTS